MYLPKATPRRLIITKNLIIEGDYYKMHAQLRVEANSSLPNLFSLSLR